MIHQLPSDPRPLHIENRRVELVVVGGGLSGVCAAVAAAREGLKVVLVQDRPVLGGNASSEVRLWALGATSHGGNNNRWAREGGIINEIMLENLYRNPTASPLILDTVILDWVLREANIELLTNTAAFQVETVEQQIQCVLAFNSQNSTLYDLQADLFVDASGDGILTHLSGAAYRMGAEDKEEFNEPMAPGEDYGKLLGHSLYFYTKDAGEPVDYVAPDFALKNIPESIPRYRRFSAKDHGCSLWWIEWGGRLDTIHQSEQIKFELQKIVYGVWDYIKNSGEFPEARNLTLEWIGTIPGKRESRRAEGDLMLTQSDIIDQVVHYDDVSHGGWSIDLHPADGVYGDKGSCNQYHSKGIFGIPFRTMYSRNISNLLITGRLLSATHVAFGSTRVMATCAANGQVVGTAAAVCLANNWSPRELAQPDNIEQLKLCLHKNGHHVPGYRPVAENLIARADISVSSQLALQTLPLSGEWLPLDRNFAQLLPITVSGERTLTIPVQVQSKTVLKVDIRTSEKPDNFTPEVSLAQLDIPVNAGDSEVILYLPELAGEGYRFLCLLENPAIAVGLSDQRLSGLVSVNQGGLEAVSTASRQEPPEGLGVDSFDFWTPQRRPEGFNLAFSTSTPLHHFDEENLVQGDCRPGSRPWAWIASPDDAKPVVSFGWEEPVQADEMTLWLDCDYDHPLETVQRRHHDRVMPFLVTDFTVTVDDRVIATITDNHQGVIRLPLGDQPFSKIQITITKTQGSPASLFGAFIAPRV